MRAREAPAAAGAFLPVFAAAIAAMAAGFFLWLGILLISLGVALASLS